MRTAKRLRTHDVADTQRLAGVLAAGFTGGEVVSLTGELGAGKTCFVQGAGRRLGVDERITSPSFLLRRDYRGHAGGNHVTVTHFDVYRLDHLGQVDDLGFDDAGRPGFITFVEWGDAARALLPQSYLEVELKLAEEPAPLVDDPSADERYDAEPRTVTLIPHGDRWARWLARIDGQLDPWRKEP